MDINNNNFLAIAVNKYIENLIFNLNNAALVSKNIDFNFLDFSIDNLPTPDSFKSKMVVYFFEIIDSYDLGESICETIDSVKKRKGNNIKFPRVNFKNSENGNRILYVGKYIDTFSTRLKQHFGCSSEKVYALHFNKWEKHSQLKLRLHYASLEDVIKKEDSQLLEIIETAIHFNLKPLLGRTGH